MDEKRQGEISRAAFKAQLRKEVSLADITSIKRNTGNAVKEDEMLAAHVAPIELYELVMMLLKEIFEEQMKAQAR